MPLNAPAALLCLWNDIKASRTIVRWVWAQGAAPTGEVLQAFADRLLRDGAALGVTRVRLQTVQAAGPQAPQWRELGG